VCNNFYNVFNPEIQYNFNFSNEQKEERKLRKEKSEETLKIFPRNVMDKFSKISLIKRKEREYDFEQYFLEKQ
jgi:hypothetical protein